MGLFVFIACEGEEDKYPDCSLVLCPPNTVLLDYRDSEDNPLINTVFVKDSFKLFTPTSTQYLKIRLQGDHYELEARYPDLETETTYFLELSDTETDTLVFNFSVLQSTCCTDYNIDSITHNGTAVTETDTHRFVLVKD